MRRGTSRKKWWNSHIFQRSLVQLSIWYSWNMWASQAQLQTACVLAQIWAKGKFTPWISPLKILKLIVKMCEWKKCERKRMEKGEARWEKWERRWIILYRSSGIVFLSCMFLSEIYFASSVPPPFFLTLCKIVAFMRYLDHSSPPHNYLWSVFAVHSFVPSSHFLI